MIQPPPQAPLQQRWRRPVRWLHGALALTISLQMLNSLIMSSPFHRHPSAFGLGVFSVHEYLGLVAAGVIVLHWLWLAIDRQHLFAHLFPWGSQNRWQVVDDLREMLCWRLPSEGERAGLAGFVHGLGLLLATAMGATGATIYLLMGNGHSPGWLLWLADATHSALSTLMWAYLGGHVLLAGVHHFIGHPTLKRMFTG
ncbi:cytochrome b/b6 domain-containing protein [Acidihalobacter ferrooxydans]|uniref:Cytochrome b561 bacterial/Ni-hydrogenase domain-containing protein n=1 Tax=Acidihalobacter ferrooxydans TaxID=1765967 RepID=A0A1P8UGB4_9GAMM|nr:cytochrome b/b6 domain-containing protein [Acidihalobacter ferrooxydans]APZ42892.1 hypothetical protein BW247_07140 [Acidihalobacter ferrooxydans]